MTPLAEDLFAQARELPAAERDAFLQQACGENAELYLEVQRLLVDAERAASFFGDDDGATLGAEEFHETYAEKEGDVIGPYKLRQAIGEGGFGSVWMAEQSVPISRMVALKVIKAGMDTKQVLARFEAERQALAMMDHPNIAKVLDAGATPTGRPWFAMELVKGIPITDYCDQAGLGTKERLALFGDVCAAINHAHQKGIIHRDIKPSNVMVTLHGDKAVVKVIDFGIAKATQGKLTDQTLFTRFEQFIGTPVYMSPEQASLSGLDIDTRSDIYALGILLYEMLVGKPPFDAKSLVSAGYEEMRRIIREVEPIKPSSRLSTVLGEERTLLAKAHRIEEGKLNKLVEPDLDWIVMKAIDKDRARRYETANAFAQDIVRFLADEAVTARPPSAGYQFRKFARRNKAAFRVAAAIAAVLVAATVVSTWQAVRATKAEALAAEEKQRAIAGEQKATAAEAVAKDAQAVAVQEKETARQALAKSQLDLAEKEFGLGKFVEAQKILEETPESFRDANWRFLRAHSRDFTAQFSITQKGEVNWLKFLPQGDRFVVKCHQGFVGIFNLAGRQEGEWIAVDRRFPTIPIGIDRTGSMAALVVSANEIAIHEMATGKLVRRWTCEVSSISQVLLSPGGGTVLAAGGNQLIAYATQTGAPIWRQPYAGTAPAISPDGLTVANLADRNGLELKVQLLDTTTGAVRTTLTATADHPDKAGLDFNGTGDQLALLGGDEVILWNPQTGVRIRALHLPGERVTRLSPGGDAVASFRGGRIRLWDTTSGRLLRSFHGAGTEVKGIAFSPDGKLLLSSHRGGGDGNVKIWPTRLGEEIASMYRADAAAGRVLIARDGSTFYTVGNDGAVASEIKTDLPKWTYSQNTGRILDLAIHPTDGSILLSGMGETLKHLSPAGEVLERLGQVRQSSVKFNRGGQLLLAVERAFNLTEPGLSFSVMEYPSGKVLRKVPFKKDSLQPFAAFCLDDAAVATAALAGGITVWDWQTGTPLRQIDAAQTGSIACLAASPDGLHLASGGPDRWIRVWEAATGRLEVAFRAHWEGVSSIEFSPDGREILSGSEDGTVRIHDAASGEERLAFYGLTGKVMDVDISADGKLIAAIATDGFKKVWDRQLSSEAALLPKRPAANKPAVAKDADGWEDLLAPLTEAKVEKTGQGWSLKDGELFSPDTKFATLPLPGELSGTSYQVRVKLRRHTGNTVFHLVLPVSVGMTGFELDGQKGKYTGLHMVNGMPVKDTPGGLTTPQVNDAEPHVLDVTVRLDGENTTITTTLDGQPLYEWTGPTAALSQSKPWSTTEPGALALGTYSGGWAVSEVKLKRLEAGNPKP